jgi:hypothetical protein
MSDYYSILYVELQKKKEIEFLERVYCVNLTKIYIFVSVL